MVVSKRLPVPTEAQEAAVLVGYLRMKGYKFHHSPNETGSSADMRRRAIRVKREGTSKGFPDYLIIVNNQLIAIELKRLKGSTTSPEQYEWITALMKAGIPAIICKGAKDAIDFVELTAKSKAITDENPF